MHFILVCKQLKYYALYVAWYCVCIKHFIINNNNHPLKLRKKTWVPCIPTPCYVWGMRRRRWWKFSLAVVTFTIYEMKNGKFVLKKVINEIKTLVCFVVNQFNKNKNKKIRQISVFSVLKQSKERPEKAQTN